MRAKPSTVMAALEPLIAVRFYFSKKHTAWQVFTLDKTSKSFYTENTKSAADERLALSITQRNEPIPWGRAAHFFLCSRLRNSSIRAMMTSANWHKSLKFSSSFISVIPLSVPDWGIFHIQETSLTRCGKSASEGQTVHRFMAAPEPHIAVRFYSTRNHLIWQCFYSTLTATSLQFSAAAIRSSARSCTMCFFCSMSATSVHETPAAEANSRCDILSACRCKIRLSISSI